MSEDWYTPVYVQSSDGQLVFRLNADGSHEIGAGFEQMIRRPERPEGAGRAYGLFVTLPPINHNLPAGA